MNTLLRKLKQKQQTGDGMATIEMIIIFPILFFLFLLFFEVTIMYNTRTSTQHAAREGVRQVSIWGGNNKPLAPASQRTPVSQQVRDLLWDPTTQKCVKNNCSKPPTVNCTPNVVARVGDRISCTITYHYKSPFKGNPFSAVFNGEWVMTEYAIAEVRG